jgi:hypothetical protein
MKSIRRCCRPTLVLAMTLMLAGPAIAALWYQDYAAAEDAIEAGDYETAVQLLEQAIQEKQESGARVRFYGTNFEAYFPFLKLGVAHYNLGNYDTALAWLEREETIGAIGESPDHLAELQETRRLAQEAREAAVAGERQRRVLEIMAAAEGLESRGDLQGAVGELGKALAVDPDNEEVDAAIARLQVEITRRQERAEEDTRFNNLLTNGRQALSDGRYSEAAASLQQAVAMRPDSETQGLLQQAQSALAAELAAEKDAAERATMIADGLERARELEGAGELGPALQAVQSVLALAPGNAEAAALQEGILLAQAEAERTRTIDEAVGSLHAQIERALEAEDYEQALVLAQQAQGRDITNQKTMDYLTRAAQLYRRQLLGPVGGGILPPPLIAFREDRRAAIDGGDAAKRETVRSAAFSLDGNVFSNAPPSIEFFLGDEKIEAAMQPSLALQDGQYLTQFNISRSLSTGLSRLRVVATDADGRSDTKEYDVYYLAPFYRRAWFYLALLVVAAAIPAAVYFRKKRQREALLRRRYNPYIAGAPVLQDKLFFGRERLLTRVLQSIHNNSILLYGERRIGKTSFQHRLKNRLNEMDDPEFDFYAVFIDLQGTPEEKFFSTLAEDMFEELGPLLDGLQPNPALTEGGKYEYKQFVRDIRSVLKVLKKRSNKQRIKLALLIDEVDELNDYDPRVNQRLRSLFMKSFAEDLVAVVSGVGIKKQWESEGSPWYNFFEEINVKPFRREDAVELIEQPINGVYDLENGVSDRIISMTDCKPYLIQKMCIALVSRLHEEGRRKIMLADVEAIGPPKEA